MRTLYTYLLLIILCTFTSGRLSNHLSAQKTLTEREKVYVHTDRTLYKPGDKIWFRAYLTDGRHDLIAPFSDVVTIDLLGPNGARVATASVFRGEDGHDGYLDLNESLPGGRYTLRAYTNWLGNFGEAHHFKKHLYVQQSSRPNLLLKLEPDREAYGPGENITYHLSVRDRFGKPLPNTLVEASLRIDGETDHSIQPTTDAKGEVQLQWPLPNDLKTTDVTISASVNTLSASETVWRPVRITLDYVRLQFFPEGGHRHGRQPQVIAFRATDAYGEPVDVSGRIFSGRRQVQTFRSQHNGYGQFTLEANSGEELHARIETPTAVDSNYQLPATNAIALAASLHTDQNEVQLTANLEGSHLWVEIRSPDSLWHEEKITSAQSTYDLAAYPAGLYEMTLYDAAMRPRWQRLFLRQPATSAQFSAFTPPVPREKDSLHFQLLTAEGTPLRGDFSVAIVDDGPFTRQNDKQPHILAQLLLQSELQGQLYEPNDYFDPKQPAAMAALKSVILCHGWRAAEWALQTTTYDHLQTGLFGKTVTQHNGNFKENRVPLFINGEKQSRIKDTLYRQRLPFPLMATLSPNAERHWEQKAYTLPLKQLYQLPLSAVQVRRTQKIKTSENERLELFEPIDIGGQLEGKAQGINIRGSRSDAVEYYVDGVRVGGQGIIPDSQLDEVVVVGYSVSKMDNTTAGASISNGYLSADEYTIREYFDVPTRPSHYFRQTHQGIALQHKWRYADFGSYRGRRRAVRGEVPALLHWEAGLSAIADTFRLPCFPPEVTATYRVIVEGISEDGSPVHLERTFSSSAPYELETKLPIHATVGDTLLLAATVRNNRKKEIELQDVVTIDESFRALSPQLNRFRLAPGESRQLLRTIAVVKEAKKARLSWTLRPQHVHHGGLHRSTEVDIRPRLFRHLATGAGGSKKAVETRFRLDEPVGEVALSVQLHSTGIGQIRDAYAGMLKEPHGCFEQASSTAYPNALIVQLLEASPSKYGQERADARKLLKNGYKKLARYEVAGGGFSLFGHKPARTDLTAYGLLQFADLSSVYQGIDSAMVGRARRFLLRQLDKEKFLPSPDQLYRLLAAIRQGSNGREALIEQHADFLAAHPEEIYHRVLLAHVYLATGKNEQARTQVQGLLHDIRDLHAPTSFRALRVSRSRGAPLIVEVLGWYAQVYLGTLGYDDEVATLISRMTKLKGESSYFPTQATVQYLKAITASIAFLPDPVSGEVTISLNGQSLRTTTYLAGESSQVNLNLPEDVLRENNDLRLSFAEAESYPFLSFRAEWMRSLPANPPDPTLEIKITTDATDDLSVGDIVRYRVELRNTTEEEVYAPMVQLGLPGNLSLLARELDPLIERGVVDFYEIDGAYLNLYFKSFAAGEARNITLDLLAETAGRQRAPASVIYPYYEPARRHWVGGDLLTVQTRQP